MIVLSVDSRTAQQIMDQKFIFVSMMLFILPITTALGKNSFNEFNFVEIKFLEAGIL